MASVVSPSVADIQLNWHRVRWEQQAECIILASTSKMRRANNYSYTPLSQNQNEALEAENDRMAEELSDKIGVLKSLSIDIGHEVRSQDRLLRGIDDDMDRTGGFLGNTMNRVLKLGKGGHNYYICYLFLFAIVVFFILYIVIKFR